MTTADMSLVAKESMLVEKLKNNMQSHFFCPILYMYEVFSVFSVVQKLKCLELKYYVLSFYERWIVTRVTESLA